MRNRLYEQMAMRTVLCALTTFYEQSFSTGNEIRMKHTFSQQNTITIKKVLDHNKIWNKISDRKSVLKILKSVQNGVQLTLIFANMEIGKIYLWMCLIRTFSTGTNAIPFNVFRNIRHHYLFFRSPWMEKPPDLNAIKLLLLLWQRNTIEWKNYTYCERKWTKMKWISSLRYT